MPVRRMITVVLLVVVLLPLLLAAGAGLFLAYGDLSRFKPQLEDAISEATGREFRIAGKFEPEVLPMLGLVVEDFTLTNADWSESAVQAQVGHLTAKVDLWALFSELVRIEELQLHDVELLIETGPDAQSNLDFPITAGKPAAADDGATQGGIPFDLHIISAGISKLQVTLRNHGAADTVVALESLQASTDPNGNLTVTANTGVDRHRFELDGIVGPLNALLAADAFAIDVAGSVSPDNLPQLPYSLAANVIPGAQTVRLEALAATLGSSDVSGSLQLTTAGNPAINGNLKSTLLDLTELESEPTTAPEPETSDRLFSDTPIDFEALRSANINLDADVGRLLAAGQQLEALSISIRLADGNLTLDNRFQINGGGSGNGTVRVNAAQNPADLAVNMNVNSLPVKGLSGSAAEAQHIPAASLAIDLRARGASPRQLAASANGTAKLELGAGRLENKLLEKVSGDLVAQLLTALNPFAKEDPYSNLECAYADLTFTDGVGTLGDVVVQTKKLQILGAGNIDLNSEKLSVTFNTKPRAGIGISADMFFTPFVRVAGTLAKPSVGLNTSGAALTTGGAIATGGLSILAQSVADRLTAEVDLCAKRSAPAQQ